MQPLLKSIFLGLVALLVCRQAQAAGVYYSTEAILKEFFRASERVSYVQVDAAPLKAQLGYTPAKERYTVFVARTAKQIDGYAVVDEERGQHLPITFAVKISPSGAVQQAAVLAYRENYGDEIRSQRFREQFVGQTPQQVPDIVAVSGATISSRSMTIAVKRAVALVELARRAAVP